MKKIQVNHEWGALKEVVVGIPHFKIPTAIPENVQKYSTTEGLAFLNNNLGETLEKADPALHSKMAEQMDGLIQVLEGRGIKVHRPDMLNKNDEKYLSCITPPGAMQIFPRDPMLVIGDNFIETEPLSPMRRRERFGIRRVLSEYLSDMNGKLVSMPPAVVSEDADKGVSGPGPFIEGGDVFLLGKDIYVGVSGNASNSAGVKWLAQYLGSKYRVHEIKLADKFLHLDCCLATPRPGLAIICREAFGDKLPDFLKGWKLIEVPFEDAKEKLACNGLIIDEKTIIIHQDLPELSKALRNAGQEVIEVPFDAIYQFSGAFRCWHHPLVRESSL